MIISLDTETTGVDFVHGAMPFLVTWCEKDGKPQFCEWDVDPLTRKPEVPAEDVEYLTELIDTAELIYLHNSKFDWRALASIGIELPWHKVRDSLFASHLLSTNTPHNLTDLCLSYLDTNIEPVELSIKEVTRIARTIAKREYPNWHIAKEGAEDMPSVKDSSKRDEDKPWKNDMWLARALIKYGCKQFIPEHWGKACSKYACADSASTIRLGPYLEEEIRRRGLWDIYEHRLQLARVACEMECVGVTAIGEYTQRTIDEYSSFCAESAEEMKRIAAEMGHDLELAEGAALNDNMRDFFYGAKHMVCPRCDYRERVKHWNGESPKHDVCPKCIKSSRKRPGTKMPLEAHYQPNLDLPIITSEKTGNATLDKNAMAEYRRTLDGPALDIIRLLTNKRKHDTGLTYMLAYSRFWVPIPDATGFYRIHPSLNPCGTDHLRWASNSPNLQNVGKQEMRCEECDGEGCEACDGSGLAMLSARNCFGPTPGREWWSMDFEQIEKRIPAYEAQEPVLIELFEKAKEPPYWGSDHNLLCSILWPDKYFPLSETKGAFKDRYINEYKAAKNTNFAKQYGAGRKKVDATAGVTGAFEMIDRATPELAKLQRKYLRDAEKIGWVETLPDRTVDPKRGYPIMAGKTDDGGVLSTTPFNYHVSGTACWCKNQAAIRCADKCKQWRSEGFDAWMILEIHDELLFDFPRGKDMEENKARALELKALMEQSGADLIPAIPTPVSVEYHSETWARGVAI